VVGGIVTSINVESFFDEVEMLLSSREVQGLQKLAAPGFLARAAQNAKGDFVGLAKSLKTPVKSLKEAFRENYMNLRTGNKIDKWKAFNAGMLGLSTAQGAHAALKKEDPTGQGRSRSERVGALVGGTTAGLLTLPHTRFALGLPVAIAGGMAGESVGGRIGRMVGPRRKMPPAPVNQPADAAPPESMAPPEAPVDQRSAYQRYSEPAMKYGGNVTDPTLRAVRQRYGRTVTNVF